MKYQISIILSILASLTFGCEVTHPVDPAFDNCRQAGGTWKDSKCLCSDGVDTVCRNNKLYTCTYGLFDQGIDCPGVCKDDKSCVLELDNIACDELSLTCNYMNIHDQNLYICNGGKLVLDKVCKNGCVDNKCVAECNVGEIECVGMYEKVCSEDGFWKTENYCPWGCEGDKCKCHKDDEICHNNTKYTCEKGVVLNKGPCDNACGMGDVKCTDEGKILQCTNGNWPSETHAVSGICEDGRLTNCKKVADGFVLNRETCEKGCDETGKSCKQASDISDPQPNGCIYNGQNIAEGQTLCNEEKTATLHCNDGNVKREGCSHGCDENSNSCKQASDNPEPFCQEDEDTKKCIDNNLRECINGQWEITNCGNKGCFNGACGECERGMSDICNGNTLEKCVDGTATKVMKIQCAFGCSNDTCNLCHDKTKCEDSMEYQCDKNGAWEGQFDATLCPNGCDNAGEKCAEKCVDNEGRDYAYWYDLLKYDENRISNLNSFMMDMYLYNCQDPNVQENGYWSVFEFKNVNANGTNGVEESIFVTISKVQGRCDYAITQNPLEKVDISEMDSSVCHYLEDCNDSNDNCKVKKLTGNLLYQYKCKIPVGGTQTVETCKLGNEPETLDFTDVTIIGICKNGEWTGFKLDNSDISCPHI